MMPRQISVSPVPRQRRPARAEQVHGGVRVAERERYRLVIRPQEEDAQDGEQEEEVAEAGDDKRLLGSSSRARSREPEPDQQVRAEADKLPPDEQQDEVVGKHQRQHRRREQGHECVVPDVAPVVAHIAVRVDLHEEAHGRDDHQHDGGQAVE